VLLETGTECKDLGRGACTEFSIEDLESASDHVAASTVCADIEGGVILILEAQSTFVDSGCERRTYWRGKVQHLRTTRGPEYADPA